MSTNTEIQPYLVIYEGVEVRAVDSREAAEHFVQRAIETTDGSVRPLIVSLAAASVADDLLKRLEVACDWLADKGAPFDHAEMVRIRETIARAKGGA